MLVDTLYHSTKLKNPYLDGLIIDSFIFARELYTTCVYKHETTIKVNQNRTIKHIASPHVKYE